MSELTAYSGFAGIGGFDLGLQRAGFRIIGSSEIDKYARKIYAKNFGAEPTESDIRNADFSQYRGRVRLGAFGFPCQAFSIAGKRLGFADTRGTLFFEIARFAAEARPEVLLLENVKGLLNHDRGRTFRVIISTLNELGYIAQWQVINGKHFLPQSRERIFIIATARENPFRAIFPISEGSGVSFEKIEGERAERERERGFGAKFLLLAQDTELSKMQEKHI